MATQWNSRMASKAAELIRSGKIPSLQQVFKEHLKMLLKFDVDIYLFHRGFLGQRILDRVHDTTDGTLTKTEAVP